MADELEKDANEVNTVADDKEAPTNEAPENITSETETIDSVRAELERARADLERVTTERDEANAALRTATIKGEKLESLRQMLSEFLGGYEDE